MSLDMYKDSSFFKALLEPNSSKLLIPNEFVRKYVEILPKEAFLMTEGEYGKCWKVKITRVEGGHFCFENGWPEFVEDNKQICGSDFAVFKLVDASTFQVSIFGQDGLKKPYSNSRLPLSTPQDVVNNRRGKRPIDCSTSRRSPSIPQDVVNNMRGKRPIDCSTSRRSPSIPQDLVNNRRRKIPIQGQTSGREGEIKSFTTVLSEHHLYCMNIPIRFAVKTGIALRSNIRLQSENGESWEVKVCTREKDGRICFRGVDWRNYWVSNSLVIGNELTFSIVGDNSGTLHVAREGLIIPCAPKKKTGRPSKF